MKFLRYFLFPFAIIYDVVTRIRNFFFDSGVFKETSFKIPVIVVGNLSVGGTGKTPQIEYLLRLLKENYKTAVLSRGYGRKSKGFLKVNNSHNAKDVGDEPLQYFNKFSNIDVAVDADRVEGITKLIEEQSPEIILLDDAYQHRKVKGSFSILLTKYDDLFVDDFLLPTGNLRESNLGAKRADVIIVTKCPENLNGITQDKIKQKLKNFRKEVFFTTISYDESTAGKRNISIHELKNYDVLLVTGIANPNPLLSFLTDQKVNFKHLKFSDHHNFTAKEIDFINEEFKKIKHSKKIILTTEKDYVRLVKNIQDISFLGIQTKFIEHGERFNTLIESHLKQNQRR